MSQLGMPWSGTWNCGCRDYRISEREQKSGSGCTIGAVLVVVFLPVLYVLSLSSTAYLITRNPALEWLGMIYAPLKMLADHWILLGDVLEWYVDLWV